MPLLLSARFDAGELVRAFSEQGATVFMGVPTMYVRLLEHLAMHPEAAQVLARARLFCDEWEQASHGGETAHALEAGRIGRGDVTELGAVLTGEAAGRQEEGEITLFDSTGLAIQDLAIAVAAYERRGSLALPSIEL